MTRLALLRFLVIVLLVAATAGLALDRPRDDTTGPQQPASALGQPLLALDAGPQTAPDPALQQSPPTTVGPGQTPSLPAAQGPLPVAGDSAGAKPPVKAPAKAPSKAASKSTAVVRCAQYNRGGSVHPLCSAGTKGAIGDVAVEKVPGTNVVVNRAWTANVSAFFAAARAAGFTLQAFDVAGPGYAAWGYPLSRT